MIGQAVTITYIVADRATTVLGRITHQHNALVQAQRTLLSAATATTLGMIGLGVAGTRTIGNLKRQFIDLNAQADETRLGMSGMLNALGYSSSMSAAQSQSKKLYDQLLRLSGPLPGEADTYIRAFEMSIGQLSSAMGKFQSKYGNTGVFGGSSGFDKEMRESKDQLSQMAAFSSYWAATAVARGVNETQVARDLPRLLSGNVGSRTVTWQKMAPQFAAAYGKPIDAKDFKKLDEVERMNLMVKVVHGMASATDLAADKQSALAGSIQTTIKQWKMLAGERTYSIYLNYLKQFDWYLRSHKTELDKIAGIVSGHLVTGIVKLKFALVDSFGWFLKHKDRIVNGFTQAGNAFNNGRTMGGAGTGQGKGLLNAVAFRVGSGVGAATDAHKVLRGHAHAFGMLLGASSILRMASHGSDLTGMARLGAGAGALSGLGRRAGGWFLGGAARLGGGALAGGIGIPLGLLNIARGGTNAYTAAQIVGRGALAGTGALGMLGATGIGARLARFGGGALGMGIGAMGVGALQGAFEAPGAATVIPRLLTALGDLLIPLDKILTPFTDLGRIIGTLVTETLPPFVEIITSFVGGALGAFASLFGGGSWKERIDMTIEGLHILGNVLHWVAMRIRGFFGGPDAPDFDTYMAGQDARRLGQRVIPGHRLEVMDTFFGRSDDQGPNAIDIAGRDTPLAKTPGGRSVTINDFRGSRFDITQKFPEGMDPDRIAAAFYNGLYSVADHKIASNLIPDGSR